MTQDPYAQPFTDEPRDPGGYRRVDDGPTRDEKTQAMWAHLGMPLGNVLGFWGVLVPIILLAVKGADSAFVNRQCKEAINFSISMFLYMLVSGILCLVIIGIVPLIFFAIFSFVMPIVAGLKAQEGVAYQYPLTVRIL